MAEKYDSNGDYGGYTGDFKRKGSTEKMSNSKDSDNDDQNPAAAKANEYIRELLAEKLLLDQNKLPNAARLIEQGWYRFNLLLA